MKNVDEILYDSNPIPFQKIVFKHEKVSSIDRFDANM